MSQNTLHTHPISDAELAGMQHHADPLADKTIADILGDWPAGDVAVDAPQWARIDTVNRLFGEWTDNQSLVGWTAQGDGVDADMARALNHYVQTAQVLPPWADHPPGCGWDGCWPGADGKGKACCTDWLGWVDPVAVESSELRAAGKEIVIVSSGAVALGGDHYITYPLLQAHAERFGAPLSLIHFDAHCDTWPDDSPDSLNHGTMFYKAVKEGLIDPAKSVQVGIRTWNDDFMGLNVLGAPWVHDNGVDATIAEIKKTIGDAPVYVTFDIDCLDPSAAPGTGTPVPGGLTTAQALKIIRNLGDLNIVGMDVVEVAPSYDQSEITAIAAAHIACDMLCLMRNKKVAGQL